MSISLPRTRNDGLMSDQRLQRARVSGQPRIPKTPPAALPSPPTAMPVEPVQQAPGADLLSLPPPIVSPDGAPDQGLAAGGTVASTLPPGWNPSLTPADFATLYPSGAGGLGGVASQDQTGTADGTAQGGSPPTGTASSDHSYSHGLAGLGVSTGNPAIDQAVGIGLSMASPVAGLAQGVMGIANTVGDVNAVDKSLTAAGMPASTTMQDIGQGVRNVFGPQIADAIGAYDAQKADALAKENLKEQENLSQEDQAQGQANRDAAAAANDPDGTAASGERASARDREDAEAGSEHGGGQSAGESDGGHESAGGESEGGSGNARTGGLVGAHDFEGLLHGPGTMTSDSIPTRLPSGHAGPNVSNNEFVVNGRTTQRIGPASLYELQIQSDAHPHARITPQDIRGLFKKGLADGGMIGAPDFSQQAFTPDALGYNPTSYEPRATISATAPNTNGAAAPALGSGTAVAALKAIGPTAAKTLGTSTVSPLSQVGSDASQFLFGGANQGTGAVAAVTPGTSMIGSDAAASNAADNVTGVLGSPTDVAGTGASLSTIGTGVGGLAGIAGGISGLVNSDTQNGVGIGGDVAQLGGGLVAAGAAGADLGIAALAPLAGLGPVGLGIAAVGAIASTLFGNKHAPHPTGAALGSIGSEGTIGTFQDETTDRGNAAPSESFVNSNILPQVNTWAKSNGLDISGQQIGFLNNAGRTALLYNPGDGSFTNGNQVIYFDQNNPASVNSAVQTLTDQLSQRAKKLPGGASPPTDASGSPAATPAPKPQAKMVTPADIQALFKGGSAAQSVAQKASPDMTSATTQGPTQAGMQSVTPTDIQKMFAQQA